jgi:hypothetical protein
VPTIWSFVDRQNMKKKKKTVWHIHLLKYKTERTTKGEKKQSNLFSSAHEAEANLFNFHYQMESKNILNNLQTNMLYFYRTSASILWCPILMQRSHIIQIIWQGA